MGEKCWEEDNANMELSNYLRIEKIIAQRYRPAYKVYTTVYLQLVVE